MSLPLTPQRLAAVYELLRAFPPFNRWGLPTGAEVKFRLLRTKRWDADWWIEGGRHHIRLSEERAGHLDTVAMAIAHEMLHVVLKPVETIVESAMGERFAELGEQHLEGLVERLTRALVRLERAKPARR
jgi:hypothetical protein